MTFSFWFGRGKARGLAIGLCMGLATLMLPGSTAQAATPQEVNAAVDKAVAFLISQQQKDGSWETTPRPTGVVDSGPSEVCKWGGESAIVTYALLAAGKKPNEEAIRKAIEWHEKNDLHGTYAVGLQSQVWNEMQENARTKPVFVARDRDKDYVLFARIQHGPQQGFYGYGYGAFSAQSLGDKPGMLNPKGPPEGSWFDRSNSQYGVLGAWALEQAGAEIPTSYWQEEDAAWKKSQLGDGGWNYNNGEGGASYTMTSAGIATLFITQDYIMRANSHQFDSCHGGVANPNIEKGLAWMDKHIGEALSGTGAWPFYAFYGIERIGVASGRKYFGTVDWYQTGAEKVVRLQAPNGSWGGTLHDTCFGLLFLVRGRAPVMMNKLIYTTPNKAQTDPWNERPRDVANLARWMGKYSLDASFVNWQLVNLQVSPEDLHDAPILYISGSEELTLSNQEIDKLRIFVEEGGMIVGNADCGRKIFATSFEKLGSKLFPRYEFRRLPMNHPIFDEQYHGAKWRVKPHVEAMSNGVREIMVLIPESDPSHAWQTDSTKTQDVMFQLGGNIFMYATGRENLTEKGDSYIVKAVGDAGRQIPLARIEAGDNWDPEPGAWPRLAAIMHNDKHVDLKMDMVKLGEGKLSGYKIAALTGTTKIILSDAQRAELKDFVSKGGTLIIDAAGGSNEFATTMEDELKKAFGDAAAAGLAQPMPATHAFYTGADVKIERFDYRIFARTLLSGAKHDPRVRAIMVGNRIGVFFSREDITAGLVGEQVDGVLGYTPAVCSALMEDMVLYAEKGGPPAAAAAAGPEPAAK